MHIHAFEIKSFFKHLSSIGENLTHHKDLEEILLDKDDYDVDIVLDLTTVSHTNK